MHTQAERDDVEAKRARIMEVLTVWLSMIYCRYDGAVNATLTIHLRV